MTEVDVQRIIADRFARWEARLLQEHSTPILLLGVGHDSKRGHAVVLTLEEFSDVDVLTWLQAAESLTRLSVRVAQNRK